MEKDAIINDATSQALKYMRTWKKRTWKKGTANLNLLERRVRGITDAAIDRIKELDMAYSEDARAQDALHKAIDDAEYEVFGIFGGDNQ